MGKHSFKLPTGNKTMVKSRGQVWRAYDHAHDGLDGVLDVNEGPLGQTTVHELQLLLAEKVLRGHKFKLSWRKFRANLWTLEQLGTHVWSGRTESYVAEAGQDTGNTLAGAIDAGNEVHPGSDPVEGPDDGEFEAVLGALGYEGGKRNKLEVNMRLLDEYISRNIFLQQVL